MARTISLTHHYDAPPAAVWRVVTDLGALAQAVDGLILYDGLPEGRIFEGQVIWVRFSLFGRLPWQDYEMRVVTCDDDAFTFQSAESGGGVKAWNHRLAVFPEGEGARVEEVVQIDAGWMTGVYCLWAKYMYGRRHRPRVEMLRSDLTRPPR